MLDRLFRLKPIATEEHRGLTRCLSALDLTLMGIGVIVGAGIFVLTGIAAATKAGPAVMLSYALAGIVCSFAALCYAELASSVGGAGSAYSYAYASLGELIAWIIGWDLILEYTLGVCTVAVGWSGYVADALISIGIHIPEYLLKSTAEGGVINLVAMSVILALCCLVALGVHQSARFNLIIVIIKLLVIGLFVVIGITRFNPMNWHPFLPFGWEGVASGAALVFFAYIGFDAVSTAAEETVNPQRDLTLGILGSLAICIVIYMVVSGVLTGLAPYYTLNVKSPVAQVILDMGFTFMAGTISIGAIAGLTSVILVFIYGISRIILAMSRDNLLPRWLSQVDHKTHTPIRIILIMGTLMALISGFFSLNELAELVNIGTLFAFMVVCASVIFLRYKKPLLIRPFKTPFSPYIPLLGIFSCGYLMLNLPTVTWFRFLGWMVLGLMFYFSYGFRKAAIGRK